MIKKAKEVKEQKKKDDDWMTKKWRPMMAMMYMFCCLADFFIFPIMFTVVQFWETQAANDAFRQWVPITLQGGGLFHVAMGAVLGVSAYGRTQEKLNGATGTPLPGAPNGQTQFAAPAVGGSTFGAPAPGFTPAPVTNSWGAQPLASGSGFGGASPTPAGFGGNPGFGAPAAGPVNSASSWGTTPITTGWGGKKAVPQFDQPEI